MFKWVGILFLCQFLSVSVSEAQAIIGLKKMDTAYVHLFTKYHDKIQPSSAELQEDLQWIKNIPGIGKAEIKYDELDDPYFLVSESTTLLPIINFGGIKDNFWYKLGLADYNFLGDGKQFSIHYQNTDRRHSGQFYFKDPYALGIKWGYTIDVNRWASIEPLFFDEGRVDYSFTYFSSSASVIRNFTIRDNLEMGINYFVEDYEKVENQFLENPPGPDQLRQPKLLLKGSYFHNRVNYDFFRLDGYNYKIALQNVYNIDEKNWFNIVQFRAHKYRKFARSGNLAMRLWLAFSTNNYSPFAPFVVDSFVNLRGVGNRIDRGTGQFVFNVEYRHSLLEAYPFGVQIVGFSDLGSWRNPGGSLSDFVDKESFRQFVGGGIRLIYQQVFGATIRIDYGIDIFDLTQRGFVVGLGQYF